MNKITSIFFLLIAMLSSCGQTNYPQQNPTVSEQTAAEQTSESTTAATAAEAKTTATTVPETVKQPVSTAVTAQPEQIQSVGTITVTTAENNVIQPKTTEAVTTASTPQINTVSQQTTTATTTVYEPTEEEKLIQTGKNLSNDGTDYGKAEAVYNFMRENGHGTCVGYSYQTLYICKGIGLECCYIQTPAQLYGHVANAVKIDGMWFVLDTQGECFLTENMCGFTEIVDENENFISDASIISKIRYDQLEYQ